MEERGEERHGGSTVGVKRRTEERLSYYSINEKYVLADKQFVEEANARVEVPALQRSPPVLSRVELRSVRRT